jgi:two-component system LytT family response regulator
MRVLIAEDEAPARRTLRTLLGEDPDIELVGETWGAATPDAVRTLRPDLLLLDVRMPAMDGFDVLRALEPDERPLVVFITAHDEHAVEAFDVRALDYVLKPFTDQRFRQAMTRARERLAAGDRGPASLPAAAAGQTARLDGIHRDRIVLHEGGRSLLLPPADIEWIEAAGVHVEIHRAAERSLVVRASIGALEDELGAHGFFRAHRSALVNLRAVREVRPLTHGDSVLLLGSGARVRLSRSRRAAFDALLAR